MSGCTAMADSETTHALIMNDSSTSAVQIPLPDPRAGRVSLRRTEAWLRDNAAFIAAICIVPLPAEPGRTPHLHAVIVPNFEWLKEHGHPNCGEFIRFELQDLAKSLDAPDRPDSFSLRSAALPLNRNGEPDRDRLSGELSQVACESAPAALHESDDPIIPQLLDLIRRYRPEPAGRSGSNLELDFGLDSLDRVLLIAAVEKSFEIHIPSDRAGRIFDLHDLADAVAELAPAHSNPAIASWAELLRAPLDAKEKSLADMILTRRPLTTLSVWMLAAMLRRVLGRCWPLAVEGLEHLPPQGAYLLIANHCSHLDPVFLLWSLPLGVIRRLSFLGHTEYFGSGWKGALAKRLRLVPVDPDQYARPGMRLGAEALRRGFVGMVFPEGERSSSGALHRFHRGIAILAREMKVPIVPAAICGTYEIYPRGATRMRCAPVQVRFGPAILPQPSDSETDLLARLWQAVHTLRGGDAQGRESTPVQLTIHPQRFS